MSESDVLGGMALLVLEVPDALLEQSRKLPRVMIGMFQRLFRNTPAWCATNIVWADGALERHGAKRGVAERGGGVRSDELAVIEFSNAAGVRHVLTHALEVVSKGQAMGLELRRGYVTLGPHRLLVEGVVKPEAAPSTAAPAGRGSEDARISHHAPVSPRRRVESDPTGVGALHTSSDRKDTHSHSRASSQDSASSSTLFSSSASEASAKPAQGRLARHVTGRVEVIATGQDAPQPAPMLPAVPEPRVVFVSLRRLYVRPDAQGTTVRGRDAKGSAGSALPDYPITPFIIFQIVRGVTYPRRILILPTRSSDQNRPRHAMGSSAQIVTGLVEVASPEEATRLINTLRDQVVELMSPSRAAASAHGGPGGAAEAVQHVEARFSVQLHLSYRRNRFGKEEVQKQIDSLGRNDPGIMIVPPLEAFNEPGWRCFRESLCRPFTRRTVPDDRGRNGGGVTPSKTVAIPTPDVRVLLGAKRARSPGAEAQALNNHTASSTPAQPRPYTQPQQAAPTAAVAAAPMAIQQQHQQQQQQLAPVRYLQPSPATMVSNLAPSAVAAAAASAGPPPPPPLMSDHLGTLPFGWRPIFSQEYQQTYYAYRDPVTGQERTTWERPQFGVQ